MDINTETVELIYDVPLGLSSWEDVAIVLQKEFKATLGLLFVAQQGKLPIIISTLSCDESIWKLYGQYYCDIDPWNILLDEGRGPINFVASGRFFMPHKAFFHTEYFNDFWKPHSLYYTAGGRLITRNNIVMQLGFPRDKVAGPYTKEEESRLNFYAQHMRRALELEGMIGNSLPQPVYELALAASYGLTGAESRLTLELIRTGESLPNIAKNLNRSYHTVRNQMKSVLGKTETSNQLELLKRLTTIQKSNADSMNEI